MLGVRTRPAALALTVAGICFLLYPALRPWHDESTSAGALDSMGSQAWVASHLFGMIGLILVPLGLLGVSAITRRTPAERPALSGLVLMWAGAGLSLPYFGAETFGLHTVASAAAEGADIDVVALAESFRLDPVAATTFALGLLGLAVGAVLIAVAVRRTTVLPSWAGSVFAAGFVLFLPQFFGPAPARIAHGVLIAAGCLWLAAAVWRRPAEPSRSDPAAPRPT